MPWRSSKNRFTPRQQEFLERFFALAKEYERDNVFASGSGVESPYTYEVIALVHYAIVLPPCTDSPQREG